MLCSYGCGKEAKFYFKTVNKWCCSDNWTRCSVMREVKSEILKGKRTGINNPRYGMKQTEETKRKIGKSKLGKPRDKETKRKLSEFRKGKTYEELVGKEVSEKLKNKLRDNMLNGWSNYMNSFPRNPEKIKRKVEKERERMLKGGAAYLNSFIKNPSKPQLKIYEIVKKNYPSAILNYPFLNYSLDIAIPELSIVIEYDGAYWHTDKEYDLKRKDRIESFGWKVIKYCGEPKKDVIQNEEQIIKDINYVK